MENAIHLVDKYDITSILGIASLILYFLTPIILALVIIIAIRKLINHIKNKAKRKKKGEKCENGQDKHKL